jgi:hypothetical protein
MIQSYARGEDTSTAINATKTDMVKVHEAAKGTMNGEVRCAVFSFDDSRIT